MRFKAGHFQGHLQGYAEGMADGLALPRVWRRMVDDGFMRAEEFYARTGLLLPNYAWIVDPDPTLWDADEGRRLDIRPGQVIILPGKPEPVRVDA
jgi:hypothetical protein